MQEHFSAGAWKPTIPKNEEIPLQAKNAGAIFGGCMQAHPKKEGIPCVPKMQEQFSAGAWITNLRQHEAPLRQVFAAPPRLR